MAHVVVIVAARTLDRVALPRPTLASPRERELRKRTRSTPHDTGAAHAIAILGALVGFVFLYRLQSTPWILCASRLSLLTKERKPRHPTARNIRTLTLTTGLACHHWDWDLGLGFGVSWCGDWCWYFLWSGSAELETPHLGPRKFCRQKIGVQISILADRRPDVARL